MELKEIESFDKTRIIYKIKKGSRASIVFIHGLTANMDYWNEVIDDYIKLGYTAITFDLRGHNNSGKPKNKEAYTFENCAKDINSILENEDIKKTILIGQCIGPMIAFKFYKLFPEKTKAIVSFAGNYKNPMKNFFPFSIVFLTPFYKLILKSLLIIDLIKKDRIKHMDFRKYNKYPNSIVYIQSVLSTLGRTVIGFYNEMFKTNMADILSEIKAPILFIVGNKEHTFPKRISIEMKNIVPNSELIILDKIGHSAPVKKPEKFNKEVIDFLKRRKL